MEENNRNDRERKCVPSYRLFIMAVLVICLLPAVMTPFQRSAANTGSGGSGIAAADTPELYADGRLNEHFLYDCAKQFESHFAFRKEMISLQAKITSLLFGESYAEGVMVGKDGWLYYEATLDDYQHRNGVSERMLFNEAHNLALMQEYTESLGKQFVFAIAPNKNSLYGNHMPERYQHMAAEQSDCERLLPYLQKEQVRYCDLFNVFRKQKEKLYYRRDSHWNNRGALLVFNALLDTAGTAHDDYADCRTERTEDYTGDLERMLEPWNPATEEQIRYDRKQTWKYREGNAPEDERIMTENASGAGKLLMYRDSFGNSLLPFCAQQYGQTVFSKIVPYPMTDLAEEDPDTVIVEKVERHLPSLSEVPPLMSGPARDDIEVPDEAPVVPSSSSEVYLSRNGSYLKFCGIADPRAVDPGTRFFIEVTDDEGYAVYEASCDSTSIRAAEAGTETGNSDALESETDGTSSDAQEDFSDTEVSDFGYLLYLSDINVSGTDIRVRVIGVDKGDYVVLQDREMTVPQ